MKIVGDFRIPHSPQKGMQLVAQATGCFWIPAAPKLAWMTAEAGNSQLALRPTAAFYALQGPAASEAGMSERSDEIPEVREGLVESSFPAAGGQGCRAE